MIMVIGELEKQKEYHYEAQQPSFTPCKTEIMQEIEECIEAFLYTPRRTERADAFLSDWMRRFTRA